MLDTCSSIGVGADRERGHASRRVEIGLRLGEFAQRNAGLFIARSEMERPREALGDSGVWLMGAGD